MCPNLIAQNQISFPPAALLYQYQSLFKLLCLYFRHFINYFSDLLYNYLKPVTDKT